MSDIFCSIITVCWNNLEGLKKTHQSLSTQSFRNYEWIIIDGDSTDGTKLYLQQLIDENIRWVSEKDNGLYDAMNKAIPLARGNYVTFLNSGDKFSNSSVLDQIKSAAGTNNNPDLIYGDANEFDESGELLLKKAYSHKRIWYGMFTHHQAVFFKRSIMPRKYNTEFTYASDYEFIAEHLQASKNIKYLETPLCDFESGGISQTGSVKIANAEQRDVRRRVLNYPWFKIWVIECIHIVFQLLRRYTPFVYRIIRYK